MKKWPFKDPDEVLDYGFNWTPRDLGTDTIVTTTATVVSGTVVVDSHTVDVVPGASTGQGTRTWLSGGTEGETCELNLHAITAAGRELEQSIQIPIKKR
jgi:hypothetical protein